MSQPEKEPAPIDSSRGRPTSVKPGGTPLVSSEPLARLHGPPERKALDSFTQPENALAPIDSRHIMFSRLTDTRQRHPMNALAPMEERDERPQKAHSGETGTSLEGLVRDEGQAWRTLERDGHKRRTSLEGFAKGAEGT